MNSRRLMKTLEMKMCNTLKNVLILYGLPAELKEKVSSLKILVKNKETELEEWRKISQGKTGEIETLKENISSLKSLLKMKKIELEECQTSSQGKTGEIETLKKLLRGK